MIRWITSKLPNSLIIFLWRKLPVSRKFKRNMAHRAARKFLVTVLGIIENEHGEILLLKHTYREEPWGIPSGLMEYEDPVSGITREIYEETKLNVEITSILKANYNSHPDRIDLYYRGKLVSGTFQKSPEISDYGFFPIDQLPEGVPIPQREILNEYAKGNIGL
ncbi:NUDIX hydrolase [Alkalibacillus aidingensis]|uniref:NUDIX hydrolase n=1 Tax=Alkalibacillus aidingensis TaxID=2747607 RepID=UPI001660A81C|nr:NUDIX hydrolase [Alkalibacillus aidingensis]